MTRSGASRKALIFTDRLPTPTSQTSLPRSSLTAIFAPLFMTRLFGFFTADGTPYYFPSAPFAAAGVLIIGAVLQFGRTMYTARVTSAA